MSIYNQNQNITIIISYESKTAKTYEININSKLKDIFQAFASDNSLSLDSIFFIWWKSNY